MSNIPTTTILHVTLIYLLVILSPLHVESAGRGHRPINVIKSVSEHEPKVQNFVTRKGPFFHGNEVSSCMPKGRKHSSAPSRFMNNQSLFHSLGCSTVARP
ncbi:hypothetical protein R6Q57_013791 [Mikania cordata]